MNDLSNVADNYPSLCIPRVFANISESRIRHVFNELALGQIYRVDMIERRADNGDVYKRVFIHFDKWFNNIEAQTTRQRLISGKDIKIVYDNPWFWKVSANRSPEIKDDRTRPRVEFTNELPRAPCLAKQELLPRAPCLDRNPDRNPDRRDDRNLDRRDDRRDDQRRHNNGQRYERQPLKSSVPKLVLKARVPIVIVPDDVVPRSPSSSPPRQRPIKQASFNASRPPVNSPASIQTEERQAEEEGVINADSDISNFDDMYEGLY